MQIVIDIPDKTYNELRYMRQWCSRFLSDYEKLILSGTPLPKGHGRLGDLDALYSDILNGIKAGNYEEGYEKYGHINNMDDVLETIKYADAIIEADKVGDTDGNS